MPQNKIKSIQLANPVSKQKHAIGAKRTAVAMQAHENVQPVLETGARRGRTCISFDGLKNMQPAYCEIKREADALRVKMDVEQSPPGFAFARDWLKTHHVCPYWLQVTQVFFKQIIDHKSIDYCCITY